MDTSENETSIRMIDYLAELEKQPTVIRRVYRTPDDVTFLIFFEDHPEFGGQVLYSRQGKPFQLIESETLRLIVGDDRWSVISGQPTKHLP